MSTYRPQSVYRPSMVFNLKLRFDESYHVVTALPKGYSQEEAAALGPGERPVFSGSANPYGVEKPLVVDGTKDSWVLGRVPKSANVELTGYRQAHKFSAVFDFRELPVDPRLVRSAGVEAHLGVVSHQDFAEGMTTRRENGTRASILDTSSGVLETREDTMLLAGIVDSWSVEHGSKSSEVHIEGRDLRSIFIDSPCDVAIRRLIDLTKPINVVVQQICAAHPLGANFDKLVKIRAEDWDQAPGGVGPPAIPSPGDDQNLTRVRQGADGKGKGAKKGAGAHQPKSEALNLSYWDLITQYCYVAGVIPYFIGYSLWLRPARSIFQTLEHAGDNPQFKTPFAGGARRTYDVIGDAPIDSGGLGHRRMVYGRDIERISYERKLSGQKAKAVEVVSLDTNRPRRGRKKDGSPNHLLTARFPKTAQQAVAAGGKVPVSGVTPSGKLSEKDVLKIPVNGINDQQTLDTLAEQLFHEICRQEMGGSCETRNLASFGGDQSDPDLVRLRPGDPVTFAVDARALSSRSPLVSELTDMTRSDPDALERELLKRIPDRNLVRAIIASTSRATVRELNLPFRTNNVKYDWSSSGLKISFDFENFVVTNFGNVGF